MKLNILHITPDFNYACGRSYYVYLLLKYLKKNGHRVFLATNGGDSLDRLDDINVEYGVIRSLKSKNPISYASCLKALKDIITEKKVEIVHTHHRYQELLGVHVSRLMKKRVKTVFTSLSLVRRKYSIEYRSDRIIAVSRSVGRMLTERFKVNEKKISLIPNFTDSGEIRLRPGTVRAGRRRNSCIILSVGRFHHEKNFEVLLKALNILKDSSFKLILVGEGSRDTDYLRYIRQHRLNVQIVAPQKDLWKFFSRADMCVLPSSTDPFPNFMLQSGLHGKPFIGTNVDGIAELIKPGLNGLLFENGNEQELAMKIRLLSHDKKLAERIARKLHSDVMKSYTQETIIPRIEKLYREALRS